MNKICTSIEQSKKLAEFLPLESADMYYFDNIPYCKYIEEDRDYWYVSHDYILAWSLAALINLLPSEFTEKGKYSTTTYKIDIRKYKFTDVKKVHEAICYLQGMVDFLEKECMERDKGKIATELFIRINGMKMEITKLVNESERILRRADIDQFGTLSKYARPYLGF